MASKTESTGRNGDPRSDGRGSVGLPRPDDGTTLGGEDSLTEVALFVIGAWSLVLSLGSSWVLARVRFLGFDQVWLPGYSFVVLSGLCFVLCQTGLASDRRRVTMFWSATPLHGVLFVPSYLTHARWPEGADCLGVLWLVIPGLGSSVAAILAFTFIVFEGNPALTKRVPDA